MFLTHSDIKLKKIIWKQIIYEVKKINKLIIYFLFLTQRFKQNQLYFH